MSSPDHTILVIRHAEISNEMPPLTVDETGRADPFGLLPRGWQRAGALPRLFDCHTAAYRLTTPTRLLAPRRGDPQADKARRMGFTIAPLSRRLNLDVDRSFDEGQEHQLAQHILGQPNGATLICWGHTFIPTLARQLAPGQSIPRRWPDDRFDMIWSFTGHPDTGYAFAQTPQRLLEYDRRDPITGQE
jgi:hypothetical protein